MGTGETVTVALPDFPLLVAVMIASPGATPVTSPAFETVATLAFALVQLNGRFVSASPAAFRTVASSCDVPEIVVETVVGATATLATTLLCDPLSATRELSHPVAPDTRSVVTHVAKILAAQRAAGTPGDQRNSAQPNATIL